MLYEVITGFSIVGKIAGRFLVGAGRPGQQGDDAQGGQDTDDVQF